MPILVVAQRDQGAELNPLRVSYAALPVAFQFARVWRMAAARPRLARCQVGGFRAEGVVFVPGDVPFGVAVS